jgi:hypothetical protein
MPMSLKEEIRLLSMVDILAPSQMRSSMTLPKGPPTLSSSKTTSYTPPRRAPRGFSSSRRAGCRYTR